MRDTITRPDTRERILDAVDCLLGRLGYSKMTLDDLAREAGIGRRTLYLHFKSKEEIALSSIDRVVAGLLEQLDGVARAAEAPDRRLREMLRCRVMFRVDSVQAYYQGFDELFAAIRPAYLARRESYFQAEARLLAGVIREGCEQQALCCADPMATARTLLLATNALLPYSLSARDLGAREQVEARVVAIADLLMDGLRRREP